MVLILSRRVIPEKTSETFCYLEGKRYNIVKMVDTYDLFKKLGSGAKFDLKRFKEDAEKFQVSNFLSYFDSIKVEPS